MLDEQTNDFIQIPVHIHHDKWENGDPVYVLVHNDETDAAIGKVSIIAQGDTIEDTKKKALILLKCHLDYHEKRSHQLDLWHPFQRGSWKGGGTHWFTTFGINVYFRRGEGMKGGWYIPFTKLNIRIFNHWWIQRRRP